MLFEKKEEVDIHDLQNISLKLFVILTQVINYCQEHHLPMMVTSIMGDKVKGRVSSTHSDGRAFDMSARGWTEQQIYRFQYLMNRDYTDYAAISKSDLKPRLIVYHDSGSGDHFHIQVRR